MRPSVTAACRTFTTIEMDKPSMPLLIAGPIASSLRPGAAVAALAGAILLVSSPARAQDADLPEKESTLVVYGEDPCPKSEDPEEIVVCARRPESERYRIPKEFRENKEERGSVAWSTRVEEMEEATRFTRPNSCSSVGSWGQTGCLESLIRNWRADRRERRAGNMVP